MSAGVGMWSRLGIEAASDWPSLQPSDNVQLGQVSGVAVDSADRVHIFHRATRVWDARSDWLAPPAPPYSTLLTL